MRNTYSKIWMILVLIFSISLTSCEKSATVEIAGPDINFQFTYSDAYQNAGKRSSDAGYLLIAKSDTIKGEDIESYLSGSGQDYTSVVESAKISNALLTLTDPANFSGVDSIQIRYQLVGTNQEIVLTQAAVNVSNTQTMNFSDLRIDKSQAFELIKSDVVASIYAIYNPTVVNCFKTGVTYRFTAKTKLMVKLSALTDGVLHTVG